MTVTLTIPAKAEYITLCRLALTGLARSRAVEEEALSDLKLALSEACSNSVRHAYRNRRAGVIQIRYDVGPESIAIEVVDDGSGFDLDLGAGNEHVSEGGLGIAIIRAVSDEFELGRRENGKGMRLRFTKRLEA